MIPFRLLALALILISSQAQAVVFTEVSKPLAPITPKPPTPVVFVPVVPIVPTVKTLTLAQATVFDGEKLNLTVTGLSSACNYYVIFTNNETKQEWQVPKTSAFPANHQFDLDLNNSQYPYGGYKIKVQGKPGIAQSGVACFGGSTETPFIKARKKINAYVANTPSIINLVLTPSTLTNNLNEYGNNEDLVFKVIGNYDQNFDDNHKCVYMASLVDKNNSAIGGVLDLSSFGKTITISLGTAWANGLIQYGEYSIQAKGQPSQAKPCAGSASKQIKIVRTKLGMDPNMPRIVDVVLKPSTAPQGATHYGDHESLKVTVVGNVANAKDVSKQCLYNVLLKDKNNVNAIRDNIGSKFGSHITIPLTDGTNPIPPGEYTLQVDPIAMATPTGVLPCLGSASKKITVYRAAGEIQSVDISANFHDYGIGSQETDTGVVDWIPKIVGRGCQYKVTRIINGGQKQTITSTHQHFDGIPENTTSELYRDKETKITFVVGPISVDYSEGNSCRGMITKNIQVYDYKNGWVQ